MRPFLSKFSLRGSACSRLLSPSRPFSFSSISPKYLSEITNLPKLAGETPDVITEIWRTFHGQSTSAHGDVIADSAPAQDLLSKKKKCPMFIVPVFKSKDSYLILFTQFQDKHIIATYLEEYRTNPTGASPWLAVNFYDDLWKDKGLSLLRCDFLPNVTKEEAKRTSEIILDSYIRDTDTSKHLETFNLSPEAFDFNSYLSYVRTKYYPEFI